MHVITRGGTQPAARNHLGERDTIAGSEFWETRLLNDKGLHGWGNAAPVKRDRTAASNLATETVLGRIVDAIRRS